LSDDYYIKIFKNAKSENEDTVNKELFLKEIHRNGILADDPRIQDLLNKFREIPETKLNYDQFSKCIKGDF
jgi:hypothetical protein